MEGEDAKNTATNNTRDQALQQYADANGLSMAVVSLAYASGGLSESKETTSGDGGGDASASGSGTGGPGGGDKNKKQASDQKQNDQQNKKENDQQKYFPPPKNGLRAFPDGGSGNYVSPSQRWRWKLPNGKILEWHKQHGDVEKDDKSGKPGSHWGSFDPNTGEQTRPADPSRWTPKFTPPDPNTSAKVGTAIGATWVPIKAGELILTVATDGTAAPLLLTP